jgi:outer membrane protein TolC
MVISPLDKDQYGAVIQADQVIWDGGAGKAQKESVIKTTISDKKRLDTEIYQVYERVNQLFFGIILINENLKISQLYIDELNRGLEKVKSGEQTGLANQSDVDAVNVELLNVMQKETELKSNRRAFLNMLNAMTGSKISADEVFKVPEISENDLNDRNLRPELEAFDAQKALILSQKNLVDAKNMLKLGAFIQGGYGKPGLNMLKNNFDSYFIGGIRLSWNFGGYYTRKNEIAQIKVNSQQVEIQKNVFLYNLNLKNSQQIENIKKIKTMIITDNNIIELRKRISAASEAKLDNGTISVSDYLSELSKLDIARRVKSAREIEYLSALYDYKNTLNN